MQDDEEGAEILRKVNQYSEEGYRVLLLGKCGSVQAEDGSVSEVSPMGLIVILDCIRKEAPDVFQYFRGQKVEIKVISGDNPVTVSKIAGKAGLLGAEKYVDASTLGDDPQSYREAVQKYNVFGRVKPEQKQKLVHAYQSEKKVVGMVGDGVNDVLALKDADCGIAMAAGSDAAKQSAHIVLWIRFCLPSEYCKRRKDDHCQHRAGQCTVSDQDTVFHPAVCHFYSSRTGVSVYPGAAVSDQCSLHRFPEFCADTGAYRRGDKYWIFASCDADGTSGGDYYGCHPACGSGFVTVLERNRSVYLYL